MSQPQIVDYQLIACLTPSSLRGDVKQAIGNGWHPLGGVAYNGQTNCFIQAVVKYAPDNRVQLGVPGRPCEMCKSSATFVHTDHEGSHYACSKHWPEIAKLKPINE